RETGTLLTKARTIRDLARALYACGTNAAPRRTSAALTPRLPDLMHAMAASLNRGLLPSNFFETKAPRRIETAALEQRLEVGVRQSDTEDLGERRRDSAHVDFAEALLRDSRPLDQEGRAHLLVVGEVAVRPLLRRRRDERARQRAPGFETELE